MQFQQPGAAGASFLQTAPSNEMLWAQTMQAGGNDLDLDGLQVGWPAHPDHPGSLQQSAAGALPAPAHPGSPLCPPLMPQDYFQQGGAGLNDPLLMQAQVPFRGGQSGLPAGFSLPPPSANLFSSIQMPVPSGQMGSGSAGGGGGGEYDSGSDDGAGGRKPSDNRAAAVQEKNRRAQKRFRERQVRRPLLLLLLLLLRGCLRKVPTRVPMCRGSAAPPTLCCLCVCARAPRAPQKAKMKDMGELLEEMSSELGKLRVENNSLKNRNTILEKVLALRDEHIRMLQDEQQVSAVGQAAASSRWRQAQRVESIVSGGLPAPQHLEFVVHRIVAHLFPSLHAPWDPLPPAGV